MNKASLKKKKTMEEFYLTEGCVKQLIEKKSFFREGCQVHVRSDDNIVYRLENPRPILKVKEIVKFDSSDPLLLNKRFGVLLTDGKEECTALLGESILYLTDKTTNGRYLQLGSVILLNEYKILAVKEILTEEEYELETNKEEQVICITDILLLGLSKDRDSKTNDDNEDDVDATTNLENEEANKNTQEATNTINELNLQFSKSAWSIKAKLVGKSLVREFQNSRNGAKGVVQRFLLMDRTGQIEAVAFNELCTITQVKDLEVNSFYLISNGDIKKARPNLKCWPQNLTVQYDLMITSNTTIIKCTNVQDESKDFEIVKTLEQKSSEQTDITNKHFKKNKLDDEIVLHEKFTKLAKLINTKKDSIVDVIGIITSVGDVKKLKKKEKLSIRNIKLIDDTEFEVSVAFWGKQAENFDIKVGSCLQINKANVSDFNGVSLNVMRYTEIFEQKEKYEIKIVSHLFEWYREYTRTENKKRKFQEDE